MRATLLGRRIVVGVVVLALVIAAAIWYGLSRREGIHFDADFTGTVGLYPGSDVRELGVKVGEVDKVTAQGTTVVVSMHLDRGRSASATTGAVIVSPSLVSDRYIQLTQLWTGGAKLGSHATIPQQKTATPVELDQLYSSLTQFADALGPNGANKDGAFSRLLNVSAQNLKGNGTEFNQTIDKLSRASATLANSKDDLFATVDNLKTFTQTLATSDASVRGLNTNLAQVSAVLAQDRQSFTDAISQLSSALGLVQGFVDQNRAKLTQDVSQLSTITQSLTDEKNSLAEAFANAPAALQNLLNAYDPTYNTLDGRGDLNELTVWAKALGVSAPVTSGAAIAPLTAAQQTAASDATGKAIASGTVPGFSSTSTSTSTSSASSSSAGTSSSTAPPTLFSSSAGSASASPSTGTTP